MRRLFTSTSYLSLLLSCATTANAQWRCDCTTVLDSCNAEVNVEANFVAVSTDHAQCARVDYFIDGMPFVSVVVDGEKREDWIIRNADPRILVQACQVCRDTAGAAVPPVAAANTLSPTSPATAERLEPMVRAEPSYPTAAQRSGIEGVVAVEFTVDQFGETQNVRVVSSQPQGVFDFSAISAVSRWRYSADPEREQTTLRETIDFKIDDFIFDSSFASAAPREAQPVQTGPVNQCIRENVSYNYGEMIEVGLINACDRLLSIHACAAGTGANTSLWVCSDTDAQQIVLSTPGSTRIGANALLTTDGTRRNATVSERFYVARAPNTEFWWIACDIEDQSCRREAQRWSASMDHQAVNVDPQVRTRAPVARSY